MDICIYHGSCLDGYAAAWAVRRRYGDMLFWYGKYQGNPPDVTGRDVIIVDFSYKRPVLLEMAAKAKSILVIDHHQTAEADLVDLPDNVQCIFDMTQSGAVLTWKSLFPNEPVPAVFLNIQDRDLWQYKLSTTRAVCEALYSYPMEMLVWDDLTLRDPAGLAQEGSTLYRKQQQEVSNTLRKQARLMLIGDHVVQAMNAHAWVTSDVGHALAELYPFGATYYDDGCFRNFSLRSSNEAYGVDVSEIAKKYGGGGHKHAAGFKLPIKRAHEELEYELHNGEAAARAREATYVEVPGDSGSTFTWVPRYQAESMVEELGAKIVFEEDEDDE